MNQRLISSTFFLVVLSIVPELSMVINGHKESQAGRGEKTSQSTLLLARVVHDSGDGSPPPPPQPQE
jgi:hypothetical protein